VLEEMGLLQRRYPVTHASKRRVIYTIVDPFLRFWFRFVAPRESRLATRADADRYLEESLLPALDDFVSEDAFERVCQAWLGERLDAAEVGWWWGPIRGYENGSPRNRRYEADTVAVGGDGAVLALGSCKWPRAENTDHEHDTVELDKLETIRDELEAPDAHLYFFDRVGFSSRLHQIAEGRDDVHLILAAELGGSASSDA
jgi:hypothetical protein